jgi:hypothetical protein
MVVGGQRNVLTALVPRKRPGTDFTGDWVVPRAALQKISPPPGFDLLSDRPVASRYTNYDIPAYHESTQGCFKLTSVLVAQYFGTLQE